MFGVDVPESSFIDFKLIKAKSIAERTFEGNLFSDVYLRIDGDLISACMNYYPPVKNGMLIMFELQLGFILHRFYVYRESPDHFSDYDMKLAL